MGSVLRRSISRTDDRQFLSLPANPVASGTYCLATPATLCFIIVREITVKKHKR
jgi:hypothetical protein